MAEGDQNTEQTSESPSGGGRIGTLAKIIGQITLLVGAVIALLEILPALKTSSFKAYCGFFDCEKPSSKDEPPPPLTPKPPSSEPMASNSPPQTAETAPSKPIDTPPIRHRVESIEPKQSRPAPTMVKPIIPTKNSIAPAITCSSTQSYRLRSNQFTPVTNFLDVRDGDEIVGIIRSIRPLSNLSLAVQSQGDRPITYRYTDEFIPWNPKLNPDNTLSNCASIYIDSTKQVPTYAYKATLTIDSPIPAGTLDIVLFVGNQGSGIDVRKR